MIPSDVYFELTQAALDSDGASALRAVERVLDGGGDTGEFTQGLLEHVRYLLVARVSDGLAGDDLSAADQERYSEAGARFQEDDLLRMLQAVSDLEARLGRVSNPRFWLELTVMKLVKMAPSPGRRRGDGPAGPVGRHAADRQGPRLTRHGCPNRASNRGRRPARAPADPPVPADVSSETPTPEVEAPEVHAAQVQAEPEPSRGDGLTLEAVREKWAGLRGAREV